ncbi:hypothetical protein PHET_09745 [Paragonimus heterotremus]|uniref:Uncharacterized protein n=1 Tax=Paragonimus heterotremus TaxID=100268 RepID=A0A8J4SGV7_9TREM|nr:hypothetical protein PHET_09745 [Paragonimus heterotremus]
MCTTDICSDDAACLTLSCLLKFESVDDCKVTHDACRGKTIRGRPVKCRVGTYFTTVPKSEKPICGVKVKHVPVAVEDSQLKALFPNDALLKFRSNLDATKSSRTVVFIFRDRNAQKAALGRFNSELLFGLRLPARPWSEFLDLLTDEYCIVFCFPMLCFFYDTIIFSTHHPLLLDTDCSTWWLCTITTIDGLHLW